MGEQANRTKSSWTTGFAATSETNAAKTAATCMICVQAKSRNKSPRPCSIKFQESSAVARASLGPKGRQRQGKCLSGERVCLPSHISIPIIIESVERIECHAVHGAASHGEIARPPRHPSLRLCVACQCMHGVYSSAAAVPKPMRLFSTSNTAVYAPMNTSLQHISCTTHQQHPTPG